MPSLRFNVVEPAKWRNLQGGFASREAGLAAQLTRNKKMAERLQSQVVTLINDRIRWRAESTGALAEATASPHNISYDTWSMGVGDEEYLDGAGTKYWRTAELGSAVTWTKHPFRGTPLWGRYGGRGYGKGALTGFWTDTSGEDNRGSKNHFVVTKESTPLHAYRDAVREIPLRDFAIANLRQTIHDIL